MGRQVYAYGLNYEKIKVSKTLIINIYEHDLNETKYHQKEQNKIDLNKIAHPESFIAQEMSLLMDSLERHFHQLNPNSYNDKEMEEAGFLNIFSVHTTDNSNEFMTLFHTLYIEKPEAYKDFLFFPLNKDQFISFFKIIKKRAPHLPLPEALKDNSDVYLLIDSY